jgi:hypothetical protein
MYLNTTSEIAYSTPPGAAVISTPRPDMPAAKIDGVAPDIIACAIARKHALAGLHVLVNAVAKDYRDFERLHPERIKVDPEWDHELGECAAVAAMAYRHALVLGLAGEIEMGRTGANDFWAKPGAGHAWLRLRLDDGETILDSPKPRVIVLAPEHWSDREFVVNMDGGKQPLFSTPEGEARETQLAGWKRLVDPCHHTDAYAWRSGRQRFQPFKRSVHGFDARWARRLMEDLEDWLDFQGPFPEFLGRVV